MLAIAAPKPARYTIVPSFAPARSVLAATHFWCLRHHSIIPSEDYNDHTDTLHDGRPPCVQHLVCTTIKVPVG